jgi:hemerythrin-like domain-containing protein
MTSVLSRLSPSITNMIRLDHTHVLSMFHQYEDDTSPRVKKGLVDTVSVAIEIHSQLEEEIFYPALRAVAETEVVQKSVPEHQHMRELIAKLRNMEPGDAQYDKTFFELMNNLMHHVADEETLLLPAAERLLSDQLGELGARMTKRRMQLAVPRGGEIAGGMARSMSVGTLLVAAGTLLAGGYLMTRPASGRGHWKSRSASAPIR